uniref:EF-hand domain-containing protein n=1 Tax=Colwellia sp. C1 TaxID=1737566 RepID=A0A0P0LDA8_9GAMM|nr:hypothetical protein [Colwellia sp. C1]
MYNILLIMVLILLLQGCSDSGQDKPNTEVETPTSGGGEPQIIDLRHAFLSYKKGTVFNFEISKKDDNDIWSKLSDVNGSKLESNNDAHIIYSIDIEKLKTEGINANSWLKISVEVDSEVKFTIVSYKNLMSDKRFIYLNEETSFLLSFIEHNDVNDVYISRLLHFLQFSDTNQDGKIDFTDIAYFDSQYFSVPKLYAYLNLPDSELVSGEVGEIYETTTEARYAKMKADFELSQKPWPFQTEDISSDYATLKFQDYLQDEINGSFISISTQCDDYQNNISKIYSAENQIIVYESCKLFYRLCDDATGLECGSSDLLYYYNQEFTTFPPHNLYAEVKSLNPVFDFTSLLAQDSFLEPYEDIKKTDGSNEVKAFLICKLIKENGYFCDESKFKLEID